MEGNLAGSPFLSVHGHFYQPPREDPFTGMLPAELGAEPYHDFNEKISAECYRPNAELGNFARISFDLGPTLARWLESHDPDTHERIVASDSVGNALAQAYNHTILPLADLREKRVQVAWGVADFRHRFGRAPEGMWLPETAVDTATLSTLADFGVGFTILAPWQAEGEVDTSEPYVVRLPDGRQMSVFFYNAALSGAVSFDANLTVDAPRFSSSVLRTHLNQAKLHRNEAQVLLVATDGELYGHHQPFRDQFLEHLLTVDAPRDGFTVGSLSQYLRDHPPRREVTIRENTSWSCHHGVRRWRDDCACSDGHGDWKWYLRRSLNRLASRIDLLFEQYAGTYLRDPWAALEDYLPLSWGTISIPEFRQRHSRVWPDKMESSRLNHLFAAQYARQMMFTSCAFFFDDLDRIEPRNAIAWAARAIEQAQAASANPLDEGFLQDLAMARSWRSGLDGAQIYRQGEAKRRERVQPTPEAVSAG